jgi:hypothetical protein
MPRKSTRPYIPQNLVGGVRPGYWTLAHVPVLRRRTSQVGDLRATRARHPHVGVIEVLQLSATTVLRHESDEGGEELGAAFVAYAIT